MFNAISSAAERKESICQSFESLILILEIIKLFIELVKLKALPPIIDITLVDVTRGVITHPRRAAC